MDPTTVAAEAPAQGAPPPVAGTPQEQAAPAQEPTPPGTATSPTTDVRALHAGFTQKSQALSAIRDELGLPKTTPDTQVLDAIKALRRPRGPEAAVSDPELAAQYAALDEQRWSLVARTYGTEWTDALRHVRDVALTTGDPEEMAAALWEAIQQAQASAQQPAAAAAPAQAAAQATTEEASEPEIGDSGPNTLARRPAPTTVTEGLEGSGNMLEAARRLFRGSART